MSVVTEAQIVESLKSVEDSDKGIDIVSAGMVTGIQIKDGHVAFAIEVDPERGAALEPIRKEAEKIVHGLPGVISATVVLTAQKASGNTAPPSAKGGGCGGGQGGGHAGHGAGAGQQAPQPDQQLAPGVKHIVAVASGKGGVGKSTTAANLTLALAASGRKVGILDADIYGPSMPRMMGCSGEPKSSNGRQLDPIENYGVKVMSMGFMVDEETPIIWRGPMVQSALEQMLRDVNWGELDCLVVDMPPGTGDAQLTMAQRVPLAGSIIVSTPQDIALLDARKGLNMFRKVDVPVFGIVENMSYYLCPNCGDRAEIFGHGGARAEAEKLGIDFLGEIPLHLDIRTTADGGRPIVVSKPDSEHAKAYLSIADQLWKKLDSLSATPKAGPNIVMQ